MLGHRLLRIALTWLASLAILMPVLAPTVSHAMQDDGPLRWAEICSASGSKQLLLDGSDTRPQDPTPSHVLEHCPYCSLHSSALGMPPAATMLPLLVALGEPVPELFLRAPRPLFAWASAQPRAPPLNC
jgi:hypothetical protein